MVIKKYPEEFTSRGIIVEVKESWVFCEPLRRCHKCIQHDNNILIKEK